MNKLAKKTIFVGVALVFALVCANFAMSAPGVRIYGPLPSTSPDSSTCGNDWANDTFDRFFRVTTSPNTDGTYTVEEQFRNGTFVTLAGSSPGGCDTNPGGTVGAGVTGKFQGSFTISVSGGIYNPAATCTSATCGTTAGFISTVFGPTATGTVSTFLFHYTAGNNGEWKNASEDRGGNHGDITGN